LLVERVVLNALANQVLVSGIFRVFDDCSIIVFEEADPSLKSKIVLGAGLEPASLSAYAPQTYVSASSTTRA